jgi:hypothetical protein
VKPPDPTIVAIDQQVDGVLQAFSPSVLPKPRDWPDKWAVTGFWQSARAPSPALLGGRASRRRR